MRNFLCGPLIVAAAEYAARVRSEPLNYTPTTPGPPLQAHPVSSLPLKAANGHVEAGPCYTRHHIGGAERPPGHRTPPLRAAVGRAASVYALIRGTRRL
jgi:hypothetical protein